MTACLTDSRGRPAILPLTLALAACGSDAADGAASAPSVAQSSALRAPASSVSQTAIQGAVTANNAFAVDLYAHIRASAPAGNLLMSPLSASLALTMAYAGADGTTATQMASALHFAAEAGSIFDGQNALSQGLAQRAAEALKGQMQAASENDQPAPAPTDYEVQIVNAVWGQKSYPWQPSFLDTLAQNYGAGVYLEDFASQPDPARLAINAWVSSQTADKIANLLPTGSIDIYTRMVLVDALHLKMPWATTFSASETMPGTFTTASGATVSASMMNQTMTYAYADDGQAQIAWLPLAGGELSVVIALPHGDLATYENALTATSGPLAAPTATALVTLSLPKVAFTSPTFSLAEALKAMGMPQAFDSKAADFTRMCADSPDGTLYIKDVLQKAMLAMEENGVEAAAATAVILDADASVALPPPVVATMVVNRPFLVAVVDATGAVLLLGHIDDPTDAGGP